jgi:hypothetical protein
MRPLDSADSHDLLLKEWAEGLEDGFEGIENDADTLDSDVSLAKSYEHGQLSLHLHARIRSKAVIDDTCDLCFALWRKGFGFYALDLSNVSICDQTSGSRGIVGVDPHSSCVDNAVLVYVGKRGKDRQGVQRCVIPSSIWLGTINQCPIYISDSSQALVTNAGLSVLSNRPILSSTGLYRKLEMSTGLSLAEQRELPDKMVENSASVVNKITKNKTPEGCIGLLERFCHEDKSPLFLIEMMGDSIRATVVRKFDDFMFETFSVIPRSFVLGPTAL